MSVLASAIAQLTSPRSVHSQTSTGEGSASVACGCDVSCACAGIQTEESWPDTAAASSAAAAAAAAAETIEGLQQELVGDVMLMADERVICDSLARCTG